MKPMTKEEVLFDTLQYYTQDISRRCLNSNGLCCYYSKDKSKSEGCAIGRLLTEEQALALNQENNGIDYQFRSNRALENMPEWLVDLGQIFLECLQSLHDNKDNWNQENNNGLTQKGKDYVKSLCISENINTQRIEQFIS